MPSRFEFISERAAAQIAEPSDGAALLPARGAVAKEQPRNDDAYTAHGPDTERERRMTTKADFTPQEWELVLEARRAPG